MKKTWIVALTAIFAVGVLLAGCPVEDDGGGEDLKPDYGLNYVDESSILAATGTGITNVTKVSDGVYKVTGKATDFQPWSENGDAPHDKRITLNIAGTFLAAERYTITYDLPMAGTVFPKPAYTAGFRVYLENTTTWAGTWQHEYAEEYNKVQGKGKVEIDRTLLMPTISNEKGDYHHLIVVLIFPDNAEDQTYEFTISNVGVYTHAVTP